MADTIMLQNVRVLIFQLFKGISWVMIFVPAVAGAQISIADTALAGPKLVRWKSLDCDNTYDPYQLVDRITSIEVNNGNTLLTINFADNCCAEFDLEVEFKDNKVFILPYPQNEKGEECDCNCCFSLELEIARLTEAGHQFYFKEKPIHKSEDPYRLLEPTFELYKGQTINKRNKYGFSEGLWMSFFPNGETKQIFHYPEVQHYREEKPLSRKVFYESGNLNWFQRGDTTEFWFEDGELKRQFLQNKVGDTTYSYRLTKHNNRKVKERSLEKSYPTIFTSDLDPNYKLEGSRNEVIYSDEYFENGQAKYRYGQDTTYAWFENGEWKSKDFATGGLQYDSTGTLVQRSYYWKKKGLSTWGDLNHYLYVTIGPKGSVTEVNYRRDEVKKDVVLSAVAYNWKWKDGKLVQSPKTWKGSLPWEKFKEIKIE